MAKLSDIFKKLLDKTTIDDKIVAGVRSLTKPRQPVVVPQTRTTRLLDNVIGGVKNFAQEYAKAPRELGTALGNTILAPYDAYLARKNAETDQRIADVLNSRSRRLTQAGDLEGSRKLSEQAASVAERAAGRYDALGERLRKTQREVVSGTTRTGLQLYGSTSPLKQILPTVGVGGILNTILGDKNKSVGERFGEGAGASVKYAGINRLTGPIVDPVADKVGLVPRVAVRSLSNLLEDIGYTKLAEDRSLTPKEVAFSLALPATMEVGGSALKAIKGKPTMIPKTDKSGYTIDDNGNYHDPKTGFFVARTNQKAVETAKANQRASGVVKAAGGGQWETGKPDPLIEIEPRKWVRQSSLVGFNSDIKTPEMKVVDTSKKLDTINPTGSVRAEYDPQSRMDMELGKNITTLDKTSGKSPDEMITIYRGAPTDQTKINPGDYITTDPQLAKDYAGTGHVISSRVRLGDILDDITEPGGGEYIYRPSKSGAETKSVGTPIEQVLATRRGSPEARIDEAGTKPTPVEQLPAQPVDPSVPLRTQSGQLLKSKTTPLETMLPQRTSVQVGGTGKIDEEALGRAELAGAERGIYDSEDFKLFGRVRNMARAKDVQAGDIETLRAKNPKVVNQALERIQEAEPNITTDEEAYARLLEIPTKAETVMPKESFGRGDQAYIAEPTAKTEADIAARKAKADELTAKKEFDEWSRAVMKQENAKGGTGGAVGRLTKAIKTSTSSPLAKDTGDLNDISGFNAQMRDVYRNFKQVFGSKYGDVKRLVLDPFDKAKGNFVDSLGKWADDLDTNVVKKYGFKKGSKESAAIQDFGEGNRDYDSLVKEFGEQKADNIVSSDAWFRKQYDTLLDEVNATRKRIYPNDPEKIIPKRKDYYRHFREMQEGVAGLLNIFDTPANIESNLAGVSGRTKPKSKWLSFAQQRLGNQTDVDAIGGFINYVKAAEYAKNIDPQTATFRNLREDLARATEDGPDAGKINNFIEYLDDFANNLAGKTNEADRFVQKVIGRKAMRALGWVNSRVKANVIIGNLSSSIAQWFNIPQGVADVGPKYAVKGAGDTLLSIFQKNKAYDQSDFIKERYASSTFDRFDTGALSNIKKFAEWITGVGDEAGTKYIWNMQYRKALDEGIANAVKYADDNTRKLVAGRGIGEVPLLQQSKTFQLVAPFQLEVQNLWHVMKDFTDEKKFGKFATLFVTSYLMNRGAEAIRGSDVSFDPINAIMDAYNTYQEEDDKAQGALKAGGRVLGEVISNVPLGQTAAEIYPEYGFKIGNTQLPTRRDFFGEGDPTRFGSGLLVARGLQDPLYKLLPAYGGQQIKRSKEGLQALLRGYSQTKSGDVRYPIEKNLRNILQAPTFGEYAVPEAKEYFDKNRRPLGEKQSSVFKSAGGGQAQIYADIMSKRADSADADKVKEQVKNSGEGASAGDTHYYLEDGEVKSVSLKYELPEFSKTGKEALDKKALSKYKGKLTSLENDTLKLYELGLIDQNEAEKRLQEISQLKDASSGSSAKKAAKALQDLTELLIKQNKAMASSAGSPLTLPKTSNLAAILSRQQKELTGGGSTSTRIEDILAKRRKELSMQAILPAKRK